MAFTKITDADRLGKGNVGQPDTPLLTTTEMQEQMDSLSNLAIDRFNQHVDELSATTAAGNIGCAVPDGVTAQPNVASLLMAAVSAANSASRLSHSHENKALLDTITTDLMTRINSLLLLMANIDTIDIIMSDDATAIPTSQAVKNFVQGYSYNRIILNQIYPVGAIYQTTLMGPNVVFGSSSEWQLLSTDSNGIKTYKRIR